MLPFFKMHQIIHVFHPFTLEPKRLENFKIEERQNLDVKQRDFKAIVLG